jgi:DNA invertase Pin-like site-specific DNA recombinase
MIDVNFDPTQPYRVVIYARMSDPSQNARSPDQQIAEIKRRLQDLGYCWVIVAVYRDDGITGRLILKRPGFAQMLRDLKSGAVKADLILVDTFQRFGRAKVLAPIRDELQDTYGILILTANSNFADPNTPQGRAMGMVDSFMATEENRIKSHNVIRGKRDAVQLKHWPGGSAPFGFQLESVMKTEQGRQVVDYSVLVPHPEEQHVLGIIFREADATGFGQVRLARHLDSLPEIPDKYKPFIPPTLARWVRNEIYIGVGTFGRFATDIINDTRVRQRNPADQVLRVEGFCEPIIDPVLFRRVKGLFDARSAQHQEKNRPPSTEKLIRPIWRGLTVKYLLTGLLFCADCGQRMTASSSAEYEAKDGEKRRYVSYVCNAHLAGHCPNGTRVPERWLRDVVIDKLRERLFPAFN